MIPTHIPNLLQSIGLSTIIPENIVLQLHSSILGTLYHFSSLPGIRHVRNRFILEGIYTNSWTLYMEFTKIKFYTTPVKVSNAFGMTY